MQQRMHSKIDLHVHSKYSDRPSEWFLRRIGAPECFVEPQAIYDRALAHGMDFVTISDHNSIQGALDIAHLPGTLISVEITTYFPEDACKIHCLATGLDERQFAMIQELRSSIYDLQRYLAEQDIVHTIAHPLFRVNDRMSIDHVEKLLVLFKRFEIINGSRDPRAAKLAETILGNLSDEMIQRMAERHGLEPVGPEPAQKWLTGGSDDHSGGNIGGAFTATPYAADVGELLAHLRRGDHEPGGSCGGSLVLGRSLYQIAYSYYKARFLGKNDGRPNIIGELFEKLLREAEPQAAAAGLGQRLAGGARLLAKSRQMRQLGPLERLIIEEFSTLFSKEERRDVASVEHHDRRTFQVACHIGQVLGYSFLRKLERHVREGHLVDSLQTVASLAPVALSFAPYLAAFSNQHKDEAFLQAVATHFPPAAHLRLRSQRKAWVTDTFSDVNGVCRTIQMLAHAAKQSGKKLTVISCLGETPQTNIELKNFRPVGSFKIPEYEMLEICFPPFLEVIEYIERNEFNEVIISTPGPLGLTALAAAKMLGLRTTGIYHTDFPLLVRHIAQDHALEQWTWRYMAWFYDQMDSIVVPSEYYRTHLIQNGFNARKLSVMSRGVDCQQFSPAKREPQFWQRRGLAADFTFIYLGRVSPDKNVDLLLQAFLQVAGRGRAVNLAVVGDGPSMPELRARYQDPRILFTGFLRGEELTAALASADVMVFPSTTDTFGNAVLEANAAGLPAIVSDRGGPPDIVRRHQSGIIVDLSQPDALADAMDTLYSDVELRSRMREASLHNATESRWEDVLEEFWDRGDAPADAATTATYRSATAEPPEGLIVMDVA
jgi:glycosyltransferase involved in cell wall biosynthesis